MARSAVGLFLGLALSLLTSTIALALYWGGPTPDGSLPVSLAIACLCVGFGGLIAGIVGERATLLQGSVVGLVMGSFVGLWPGSFPLKLLFHEVAIWRIGVVPIATAAGAVGGWLAGRLMAPGGFLAGK